MARKKKSQNPVPLKYQKNCIIYTRISDPNKQTEVSIAAQTRECRDFAKKFGLTVIDVLEDKGTGTNLDRPKFYELQQRAKQQNFRYILVWRYDRFSRSQQDTYAAIGYFGNYGINIVPIKEQSSLEQTSEEKLLAGLYISMAEYYSAELSVKVCRNMYELAKNGIYFGGSAPLGYKAVNKELVVDELTAHIVQEAFNMYADGHSIREICDVFNKKGYKTSTGNDFTLNSFRGMLSNERYMGVYSYTATDPNGEEVKFRFEHKIPALVSEDLFGRVQEKLRQTSKGPGTGKAKVPYLLKEKIFCGLCGQSMKSDSNRKKNGDVYRYYNCRKNRPGSICKRKILPKDMIELNVAARVLELLNDPEYVALVYDVLQKKMGGGSKSKKISAMKAKVKELERSIRTTTEKLIKHDMGEIDISVYVRKAYEAAIDEDSINVEKLKAAIEREEALSQTRAITQYDIEDWLSELRTYNLHSFEDRQHLISTYVKQVIVYEDSVEVILNTPGDISELENAELTIACAKTYMDFKNENTEVTLPNDLEITEAEAETAISNLIASDNDDDDPDPDDPNGGGSGTHNSGGGSSMGKKSTRPYNKKKPDTAKNSEDLKGSTLARRGAPEHLPTNA